MPSTSPCFHQPAWLLVFRIYRWGRNLEGEAGSSRLKECNRYGPRHHRLKSVANGESAEADRADAAAPLAACCPSLQGRESIRCVTCCKRADSLAGKPPVTHARGRRTAMVISSRTPEGQPNYCPVCRQEAVMEPSQPFGDAPCPHCGCLLRFEPLDKGVCVSVAEAASAEAERIESHSMYVCPKCKTRIPFGTETKPPPSECPGCGRRLGIPTTLKNLPPNLAGKSSQ